MLNLAFIYDYVANKWVKCTEPSYINDDIENTPHILMCSFSTDRWKENIKAGINYVLCPEHGVFEEVSSCDITEIKMVTGCKFNGIIGHCSFGFSEYYHGYHPKYVPLRWRIFQRTPESTINISCDTMKVIGRHIGLLKQLKVFSISINPLKGKLIINKINKNNGALAVNTVFSMYSDHYKSDDYDEWTEVTGIDKPYFMEKDIISAVEESINHVYGFRPSVLSTIKRDNKFLAYIERPFDINIVYLKPFFDHFIGNNFDKVFPFEQTDNYRLFCKMLEIKPPKSLRRAYTYNPYAIVSYMLLRQWGVEDVNYMQRLFYVDNVIGNIPIDKFYYNKEKGQVESKHVGWEDLNFYCLWLSKHKDARSLARWLEKVSEKGGLNRTQQDILHSFRIYFSTLSEDVKHRLLEDGLTYYVHDAISWEITAKANNYKNVRITYHELVLPYQCRINDYEFRLVTNTAELRHIGLALSNCVATYRSKVIHHDSIIVYVVHKNEYVACIELLQGRYIYQALGNKNSRLSGELLRVCRFWMKYHQLVDSEGDLYVYPLDEADDITDAVVETIPYNKSVYEMNLMELINIDQEDIEPGYYIRLGKLLGEEYTHSVKAPTWVSFCDEKSELLYSLPEGRAIFDAAFNGCVEAMRALAFMYYHGHGIKRDWKKTRFWLQKAINLGSKEARKDKYKIENAMNNAFLPLDCVVSTALQYIRQNLNCNEKKLDKFQFEDIKEETVPPLKGSAAVAMQYLQENLR